MIGATPPGVDVLLRLATQDVPALPVHACIVVAESDLRAAHQAMIETFERHTGIQAKVSIERAA